MIPIERCRNILGKDCTLSDAELENLRDQLYSLADIAVECKLQKKRQKKKQKAKADKPIDGLKECA